MRLTVMIHISENGQRMKPRYLSGTTASPKVHFYGWLWRYVYGLPQWEEDWEPGMFIICQNYKLWQDMDNIAANYIKTRLPVSTDQLNMFGVHVFGSIPRWTSLYSTASQNNHMKTLWWYKLATMSRNPKESTATYRAQGMILYLVVAQTATWYTFGWWLLVRNSDVWKKKPTHVRWALNVVMK
jgi:hypothetical protein